MKLQEIKEFLFSAGRNYGFSDMEIYQQNSRSFELRVFNREIDHYAINEDKGISFRGIIEGKMGYSYTERTARGSIKTLLEEARQNALIIDKKEGEIFKGSEDYKELEGCSDELLAIDAKEKIELIKALEEEAFARDDRVTAVNYCLYVDNEIQQNLVNSKGLDLNFKNNISYAYLSVVAQEGNDIRTGSKFFSTKDFSKFDVKKIAHKAVDEAVSLFGARTLPSKKYPIILRYDVAAEILATFSSTFSAENVQKGLSLFRGRLGERVASEKVTLIDDPFMKEGFRTTPFDAEGVATRKKNVIEEGRLTTFLHNLKSARKDGVESSGNAFRSSYKDFIGIAPTNMFIKPGTSSYQELIGSLEEGIVIIEVQGLHSGADPVSGDFSLGALGYYIKNGEVKTSVEQITIAGNFLELLRNIEELGNDFSLNLPERGHFGSPSLKIKALAVSGE